MRDDEFADCLFKLRDTLMRTTSDLFVRQFGKPTLHLIVAPIAIVIAALVFVIGFLAILRGSRGAMYTRGS